MLGIHRTRIREFGTRAPHGPWPARPARRTPRREWRVEALEARALLSTWPVTSLGDSGEHTLRWAIDQANYFTGPDTIRFEVTGTIALASALPEFSDLTGATDCEGPGADRLTISGGGSGIFTVQPGVAVSIAGLTISGGQAEQGGGILSRGTLTVVESRITNNTANSNGGGLAAIGGSLMLTRTTVAGNAALASGGGVYCGPGTDVTITESQISDNVVRSSGGGIYLGVDDGTALIARSTVSGNHAQGDGSDASGGGILIASGSVVLKSDTISGNEARGADAPGGDGGLGGFFGLGGGVMVTGGVVDADCTTFQANSAVGGRGGTDYSSTSEHWEGWNYDDVDYPYYQIYDITRYTTREGIGGPGYGGGLAVASGTMSARYCTFADNISRGGEQWNDSIGYHGYKSELWYYTYEIDPETGQYRIDPDTGERILQLVEYYPYESLDYAWIGAWPGSADGGGIFNDYGAVRLTNTIVAKSGGGGELSGGIAGDFNLIGDASGLDPATNILGIEPLLGPLQDNGGPTQTMALMPGSPAIDAGIAVEGVTTDQRGVSRTEYGPPDIGAFECQIVPGGPPRAIAGGPYVIQEGDSLALDASGSEWYHSLTYSWEVSSDGSFTHASGVQPTLSWDQLRSLGIDEGPATFDVKVQVEDGFGNKAISSAVGLKVLNAAPTATLSINGPIQVGEAVTVQFSNASDPSPVDMAAGFHYAFTTDPAALAGATYENSGTTPFASFTLLTAGEQTIYGRVLDEDNGYSDYATQVVVYYQPGTLVVVNTDDSGAGSLRDAVDYSSPGSRIVFDSGLQGRTIVLTSGELFIDKSLDIKGLGATSLAVSGGETSRVFSIAGGAGAVAISNLTITGGQAQKGGGLYNAGTATLTDCILGGNSADWGGGIFNWGTLTLTACTLTGNSAREEGGGIVNWDAAKLTLTACTLTGNSAIAGGGIQNRGTLTLTACALDSNSANWGGGIANTVGALTLTACTLGGNSAIDGGGIYNYWGTATITACTLGGNSADWGGGGIYNYDGGLLMLTLTDSIVADSPSGGDLAGTFAGGSNLICDGSGGLDTATNLLGADPMLGPLQDNGGATWTMALLPGSPAIDAGIPVEGINTDQRGLSRTISGAPDIGAFEFATLSMGPVAVNGVEVQRSNVTTVALPFNQWTNIPALIADGSIASAVRLFAVRDSGEDQVPLQVTRYQYDRDSFTLTLDLLGDKRNTMLADGQYELRIDTGLVYALGNSTNPLADSDGIADGRMTAGFPRLEGDFNGDGAVTVLDRTEFLGHFGFKLGQSMYDYAFDLNGDGLINILDYNIWLKQRGKGVRP